MTKTQSSEEPEINRKLEKMLASDLDWILSGSAYASTWEEKLSRLLQSDFLLDEVVGDIAKIGTIILPVLLAALENTDLTVQRNAMAVLKKMILAKPEIIATPEGANVVPALVETLKDDSNINPRDIFLDPKIRLNVFPSLIGALKHENPIIRIRSTQMLATIAVTEKNAGGVIDTIVPAILGQLNDSDTEKRIENICAIRSIAMFAEGRNWNETADSLTPFLDDPDAKIRGSVVDVIGHMSLSDHAKPVLAKRVDKLAERLGDEDSEVREKAAVALESIAWNFDIDFELVGKNLAEYVAKVEESGSPDAEIKVVEARKEAAQLYSKIASAASKRVQHSKEMAGEMLSPSIRPVQPRGFNGAFRQATMHDKMAKVATGRTTMGGVAFA